MPVSRRLRFEVLQRDGHTCRYCGATAPDVRLTVDHVVPVALGGSDEPSNLAAACADCNAGKSSTAPGRPLIEQVAHDAERWAHAMRTAAERADAEEAEISAFVGAVAQLWHEYATNVMGRPLMPDGWEATARTWARLGVTVGMVEKAAMVAPRCRDSYGRWPYFCKVVWNRLTEQQEMARAMLSEHESEA